MVTLIQIESFVFLFVPYVRMATIHDQLENRTQHYISLTLFERTSASCTRNTFFDKFFFNNCPSHHGMGYLSDIADPMGWDGFKNFPPHPIPWDTIF